MSTDREYTLDGYLSKPDITTRTRRLYTFASKLHLQIQAPSVDGTGTVPLRVRVVAAEGQSEEADTHQEFLVLERLYDDEGHTWDLSGPEHQVLGVWVHQAAIVSAQVRVLPWDVGSLRDLVRKRESDLCDNVLEDGDLICREARGHNGAHRNGARRWS